MQTYVLFCIVFTLTTGARLNFYSDDCKVFLGKFKTQNYENGTDTGVSKIAFSGHTSLIGNNADVQVKLRYSDFDYFNDPKFKGLVLQDGKTPETTCLDMKLLKYADSNFSGRAEFTDLTITPSENLTEKQRFYSFTIKGSELGTRMIETNNSYYLIYQGYYAIAFYAAETYQLFYIFQFFFTVIVDRENGVIVDTLFDQISPQYSSGLSFNLTPETSIQWCTDFTCQQFAIPDLHFKDQFVLLQTITAQGLSDYYLTGSEVWYTGNGLNKKATIKKFDNKTPGQVKLVLNAEIVWRAVTIKVISVLSINADGARRLLEQTTFDVIIGQTEEITCIKPECSDTCATCEQECDVNGFAGDKCDSCSLAEILTALLMLYLVFTL